LRDCPAAVFLDGTHRSPEPILRLTLALGLAILSAPALAETRLGVSAAAPEAAADAAALIAALEADLAGAHKGCPVTVGEGGDLVILVTHEPGPPAGWSLAIGPAEAPGFAASGATGDMASAAAGILEKLCPKQGGAATVGAWEASGGGEMIKVYGQVADLLAPFTLEGDFPGGHAVFEYIPVSIGGGPVTYALSGSGVTGSGEGVYSLEAMPDGIYKLVQTTEGCVDGIPNSCRTNTETIILTPIGR
jgi:hypothetical protein